MTRQRSISKRPDENLDAFVARVVANSRPPSTEAAATLRRLLPPVRAARTSARRFRAA